MSKNCPTYKQKLESWKTSLRQVEALKKQFLETGDLNLRQKFEELREGLESSKKAFLDFAYEEVEVDEDKTSPRIDFDVKRSAEGLFFNESTPWETIDRLSKIPNIIIDLTDIKREYKGLIEHWEGGLKDFSQEFSYAKLQTIREDLDIRMANAFSVDSLQVAGGLNVPNANIFFAPQLEEANEIFLTKKNFSEF